MIGGVSGTWVAGLIPGPLQWFNGPVCCSVGYNSGSDLIPGLGMLYALERPKKKKKKKKFMKEKKKQKHRAEGT